MDLMYKVFVVDDEPSVIEGLKIMIPWKEMDFDLCGEASNAQEAIAKIEELRPHLLISDIRMPHKSGLALINDVRKLNFDMEFIMLSGYSDFSYAQEAMRNQVFDYLLKPLDREEIISVLQKVSKKLDDRFLAKYGFTREDIEAVKAGLSPTAVKYEPLDGKGLPDCGECHSFKTDFDEEFTKAVKLMDFADAKKLIDEMFDYIRSDGISQAEVRIMINSCIYHILHAAYERNISLTNVLPVEKSEQWSCDEAFESILGILLETIDKMKEDRRRISHGYLYDVKEYIEAHYNEELSVSQLAEMNYAEAGYLGEAFIKHFGCSINEYQHRLRIKKAIELIKSTNMKLSEISNAVGYNNYNNFFSRFEKITHKKPTEFDAK